MPVRGAQRLGRRAHVPRLRASYSHRAGRLAVFWWAPRRISTWLAGRLPTSLRAAAKWLRPWSNFPSPCGCTSASSNCRWPPTKPRPKAGHAARHPLRPAHTDRWFRFSRWCSAWASHRERLRWRFPMNLCFWVSDHLRTRSANARARPSRVHRADRQLHTIIFAYAADLFTLRARLLPHLAFGDARASRHAAAGVNRRLGAGVRVALAIHWTRKAARSAPSCSTWRCSAQCCVRAANGLLHSAARPFAANGAAYVSPLGIPGAAIAASSPF